MEIPKNETHNNPWFILYRVPIAWHEGTEHANVL